MMTTLEAASTLILVFVSTAIGSVSVIDGRHGVALVVGEPVSGNKHSFN